MVMTMMIISKEYGNDNVSLMMTQMIMIKMMLTAMTKVQPEASQVCRAMSCSEEVRPGKRMVVITMMMVMVGPGALYVMAHFYMNIFSISSYKKVCVSWMCHCYLDISVAPHRGRDSWPLRMIFG